MKDRTNRLITQGISLIILVAALVIPRGFELARFVAVDEVNWLHRSATFYDAVVTNRWGDTLVNTSPGVITTWVGALAMKIAAPDYRVTRDIMKTSYTAFQNNLTRDHKVQPLYLLALARAIMIVLLVASLLICYCYAQRLFGILPALIGFLIIALDPFLIALTRMNHLDAPQAIFMVLSLLAFLTYLFRGKRWFDLVVSGAGGGLAFLSKLPGIFIVPTIGLLSIWDYFKTRSSRKAGEINPFWKFVRYLMVWALVFMLAYAALWPAMWVQPLDTVQTIYEQSFSYSSQIVEEDPDEIGAIPNSLLSHPLSYYFRYPDTYLWRTTPVVLLGLLLLLYAFVSRNDVVNDETFRRSVLGLLLFVLIYTLGMTLPAKASDKYYAPVHIVMGLLSGLGWYAFSHSLSKKISRFRGEYLQAAILIVVIFVQSLWVYRSFPYFYTYYNPMLGGLPKAAQTKFIGVGEGLDRAGLYLISKPNASQLQVMSWYGIGPLSYYFDGEVDPLYMSNSAWTPEFIQKLSEMDYIVIYTNQKHRNRPPELFKLLEGIEPEHTVTISGAEYAWIYKVSDIPLPDQDK